MAQLTAADLIKELSTVAPTTLVVFQGNVSSEDDKPSDEPSYTICTGYVYSGFHRNTEHVDGEFVIDVAITDSEGGIVA
jgi:hypothetical protein